MVTFKKRPTGNTTYKIYDLLGIKLLTRLWLGFSHISEHKFRHNDSPNPLCSCSLETESTLHFFLCCQNYTTSRRALMTNLENINDAIMSLNENGLLYITLYEKKDFENDMNISILTATIKFTKDSERFDQSLFKLTLKPFLFLDPYPFKIFYSISPMYCNLDFCLNIFFTFLFTNDL